MIQYQTSFELRRRELLIMDWCLSMITTIDESHRPATTRGTIIDLEIEAIRDTESDSNVVPVVSFQADSPVAV